MIANQIRFCARAWKGRLRNLVSLAADAAFDAGVVDRSGRLGHPGTLAGLDHCAVLSRAFRWGLRRAGVVPLMNFQVLVLNSRWLSAVIVAGCCLY